MLAVKNINSIYDWAVSGEEEDLLNLFNASQNVLFFSHWSEWGLCWIIQDFT